MSTASRPARSEAGHSSGLEKPVIGLAAFPDRVAYREGLALQRRLARDRIEGRSEEDVLLLMEHDPVLTLGRGTDPDHLTASADELEERGVELAEIERGGDVTFHGPGQLVGYPILDLRRYRKDLHWYLRTLEEALIGALAELGLPAFRVPGHTGVWVGDPAVADAAGAGADGDEPAPAIDGPAPAIAAGRVRKVASIGVHVSRWVTWHGFALNVRERALDSFELIVPCGIRGVRMTSLESEGIVPGESRLRDAIARGFAVAFDARVVRRDAPSLRAVEAAAGRPAAAGGSHRAAREGSP